MSILNSLAKSIKSRFVKIQETEEAYFKGDPIMVDEQYDRELEDLHQKYEEYLRLNGGIDNLKLEITPATEVDKVRTYQEFEEWLLDNTTSDGENDYLYCIEPKYDGVNLTLVYRGGTLKQALMRGNRGKRKDILPLLAGNKTFPHQKLRLMSGDIDVQGELLFRISSLEAINKALQPKTDYCTARSALVASINAGEAEILSEYAVFKPFKYISSVGVVKIEPCYKQYKFEPQLSYKTTLDRVSNIFKSVISDGVKFNEIIKEASDFELDGIVFVHNVETRSESKLNQIVEDPHIALKPRAPYKTITEVRAIERKKTSYTLIVDPVMVGDRAYRKVTVKDRSLIENEAIREGDLVEILIQNDHAKFNGKTSLGKMIEDLAEETLKNLI